MNTVRLAPGQKVWLKDLPHEVVRVEGQVLKLKLAVDENAPIKEVVLSSVISSGDMKFVSPFEGQQTPLWDALSDEQQEVARTLYKTIEPYSDMINTGVKKAEAVQTLARQSGVSTRTIYERVRLFRQAGIAGLAPGINRGGKNMKRLDAAVEQIIENKIARHYLIRTKVSVSKLTEIIRRECEMLGLKAPQRQTIQRRINHLSPVKVHAAQKGKQATRSKYHVSRGKFPGADFPLAIVQFDHTPLDIILVDREHRVAIGRPYLTLAIDVCSRMVYGYFLSLQKPSYVSVAMCLLAGINSKDNLLERFSLDAEDWPVFGLPACIHVDNGKEFRSTHLEDFCKEYQINLEYRPIRTPQYGGHIERLFGTINEQCHQLEGTTFSSVYHKGDYQSEKYANLTLDELEEYLVNTILEYHLEVHDGVSMPPKRCWEREVLDGLVSPYIPTDQTRMVIDLLPFKKRTIQKEGVGMFDLHYTSDVLQNIHFAQKQEKQMYKVKYDPRDISKVYLLNPAQNRYEVLFLTDRRIGPISKIELDQIKRVIKVENERFDKSNLARYKDRKQGIIDRAKANKFESKRQRRIHEQISRGAEQAEKLHPGRKTKLPDLPATVPEVDLAAIKFDDLD